MELVTNGRRRSSSSDPERPLLYILREEFDLIGAKYGCGEGQCGACTVLVDGSTMRSCMLPASAAENKSVTTLEGLGNVAHPHPIQAAFIEEQAAQCGYCMNGMVMGAKALLDKNPHPTVSDIKRSLNSYLCRCGTHLRVIRAIQRVSNSSVKA